MPFFLFSPRIRPETCLGKYVNDIMDTATKPNCKMKMIDVEGQSHLCLFAVTDIPAGSELRYDYGVKDAP